MKILITGFESFDGETVNPSYEAVRLLSDAIAGAEIAKLQLPTVFSQCGPAVEAGILAYRPDAALCVGQAGERAHIAAEQVGIDLIDAHIPDSARPVDTPINPDGTPDLPLTVIAKALTLAAEAIVEL